MNRKAHQLGMNPSTASHRLVKDLLWFFVQGESSLCYRCGELMDRETFSIEHKTPWLDSYDPLGLYFELDNVAFSHLSCNISAGRRQKADHGTEDRYKNGCRCAPCKAYKADRYKARYTPSVRRERYLRTGR